MVFKSFKLPLLLGYSLESLKSSSNYRGLGFPSQFFVQFNFSFEYPKASFLIILLIFLLFVEDSDDDDALGWIRVK